MIRLLEKAKKNNLSSQIFLGVKILKLVIYKFKEFFAQEIFIKNLHALENSATFPMLEILNWKSAIHILI